MLKLFIKNVNGENFSFMLMFFWYKNWFLFDFKSKMCLLYLMKTVFLLKRISFRKCLTNENGFSIDLLKKKKKKVEKNSKLLKKVFFSLVNF